MRYLRKFFFWLHLAVGVTAGLVIALMAATGMILAFERPVLRVMDAPAPFEQQSLAEHPLTIAELLPRLGIGPKNMPTELVLHREPMPLLEVRYGHDRTFFANPWTGELIGSPASGLHHFFSIVTNLHRRLGFGMKNALAHNVVGAADLAFLFLLLSGLYLWLPRLWNKANLRGRVFFLASARGRMREWNWHHVFGLWLAIPLVLITMTGAVLAYPWATQLLYTMTGSQMPAQDQHRAAHANEGGPRPQPFIDPQLDRWVQMAASAVPDWQLLRVPMLPANEQKITLTADRSQGGRPEKAVAITIDRSSQRIQQVDEFSSNPLGRKLRLWARFVHTGEEFGLVGALVAALSALAALLLCWTGIAMAVRRMMRALHGNEAPKAA